MKNKYVVFDLDDTLFPEIDYLKSAFREIAVNFEEDEFPAMMHKYEAGENVFAYLSEKYGVSVEELLEKYRTHFPKIKLNDGAEEVLKFCKQHNFRLGLITDGRSLTQRNKLKALNIEDYFEKIIISEEFGSAKPDERNYRIFVEDTDITYFYIADNIKKDFVVPNKLGWTTIALKNSGKNIHKQNFDLPGQYLPHIIIERLNEAISWINSP